MLPGTQRERNGTQWSEAHIEPDSRDDAGAIDDADEGADGDVKADKPWSILDSSSSPHIPTNHGLTALREDYGSKMQVKLAVSDTRIRAEAATWNCEIVSRKTAATIRPIRILPHFTQRTAKGRDATNNRTSHNKMKDGHKYTSS